MYDIGKSGAYCMYTLIVMSVEVKASVLYRNYQIYNY
jgi:hypothetical protein